MMRSLLAPRTLGVAALLLVLTGLGTARCAQAAREETVDLRQRQAAMRQDQIEARSALRSERIKLELERAREAPFTEATPYLELVLEDGRLILGQGVARLREIPFRAAVSPGVRQIRQVDRLTILVDDDLRLDRVPLGQAPDSSSAGTFPLTPADFDALRAILRPGHRVFVY